MKKGIKIAVFVGLPIAVAGVGYFVYAKRKNDNSNNFEQLDIEENTTNTESYSKKRVIALQSEINKLLTKYAPDYELLVVDGVMGQKTKAAIEYLKQLQIEKTIDVKKILKF